MNGKKFDDFDIWALDDRDRPTDTEIEFSCGQIHNLTVYWQFSDSNTLYKQLMAEYKSRGPADKDNPHLIGKLRIGPDDTSVKIGFFPKGTDHGIIENGIYDQNQAFIINLYDDIENAEITSTLGKSRIEVAERDSELVQKDGSQFTWPSGYTSKTRYEGSAINVTTSNISSLAEVIGRVRSIFANSNLEIDFDTYLRQQFIDDTFRFANPEVYHRFLNQYLRSVKQTIRQSSRLLATGDGNDGEFDAGCNEIVGFSTDCIDHLGFDVDVSAGALSKPIPSIHIKVYRTKNPERYEETDCLYHPKIEVEAHKAYPAPLFDQVIHRLNSILNAHLYHFAGVERSDLVQDRYYKGADESTVSTKSPNEYRSRLMEFYASDLFEKNVYEYICRQHTDVPKYMLFLLDQNGFMTYSQLSNIIGVTKKTIGKWGNRMKDSGICRIVPGNMYRLELVDKLRDRVTKMIDPGKAVGEIRREIRKANHGQDTAAAESHTTNDRLQHKFPISKIIVPIPMDEMGQTPPEILQAPGPP